MSLDADKLLRLAVELIPVVNKLGPDVDEETACRRSISTSYYALFHCIVAEACNVLVSEGLEAASHRAFLATKFDHGRIDDVLKQIGNAKKADEKQIWSKAFIMSDGKDALAEHPNFAKSLAIDFNKLKSQRILADYDTQFAPTEFDALLAWQNAKNSIEKWRTEPTTPTERFLKRSLNLLFLLGTQNRT